MIEICRDHSTNGTHWWDGTMALRWCAAGMNEAATQFRRVNGHLHLPALRAALEAEAARRRRGDPSRMRVTPQTTTRTWPEPATDRHRSSTELGTSSLAAAACCYPLRGPPRRLRGLDAPANASPPRRSPPAHGVAILDLVARRGALASRSRAAVGQAGRSRSRVVVERRSSTRRRASSDAYWFPWRA